MTPSVNKNGSYNGAQFEGVPVPVMATTKTGIEQARQNLRKVTDTAKEKIETAPPAASASRPKTPPKSMQDNTRKDSKIGAAAKETIIASPVQAAPPPRIPPPLPSRDKMPVPVGSPSKDPKSTPVNPLSPPKRPTSPAAKVSLITTKQAQSSVSNSPQSPSKRPPTLDTTTSSSIKNEPSSPKKLASPKAGPPTPARPTPLSKLKEELEAVRKEQFRLISICLKVADKRIEKENKLINDGEIQEKYSGELDALKQDPKYTESDIRQIIINKGLTDPNNILSVKPKKRAKFICDSLELEKTLSKGIQELSEKEMEILEEIEKIK